MINAETLESSISSVEGIVGSVNENNLIDGSIANSEVLNAEVYSAGDLTGSVNENNSVEGELNNTTTVSEVSGTMNYNELYNQPKINGVTLIGNKTPGELGVQGSMDALTNSDIENLINNQA